MDRVCRTHLFACCMGAVSYTHLVNNGLLQRDPFFAYSITKEETKRGFLTQEEITILINGTFKKKSYELIRDLFIFCTFTGCLLYTSSCV